MVYGKKDPDLLYIFYLPCCCRFSFRWKQHKIFSKMLKPNHIKIVIFRKHFSLSLRNIYDLMFLFWHFDVFYFFIQFSAKKSALKTLFQHIFAISDAPFDPNWHKLYYQYKIQSLRIKKSKTTFAGLWKCQQEAIARNWLKLAKIKKKLSHLSCISVSDHPKINQSCFTKRRIL